MSNQDKLYEARDIINSCLLAVRPVATSGPAYFQWAQDRANNAAQALTLLLCPEGQCRGPVPQTEAEWNEAAKEIK